MTNGAEEWLRSVYDAAFRYNVNVGKAQTHKDKQGDMKMEEELSTLDRPTVFCPDGPKEVVSMYLELGWVERYATRLAQAAAHLRIALEKGDDEHKLNHRHEHLGHHFQSIINSMERVNAMLDKETDNE